MSKPRSSTASIDRSGFYEFFRHHGAWAPGVRLFRRMRFATKLALMLLSLLVPVLILLGLHISNINEQSQFTSRERLGVQHIQQLTAVAHHLLRARNATRAIMGGLDVKADYVQARSDTDAALNGFARVLTEQQDALGVRREFDALRTAWAATTQAANGTDASGKRTVFGPVSEAAVALFQRVLDRSGISLDPDLDSFYLGNAFAVVMPQLMEDFGQVWGWSSFLAAKDDNITFEDLTAAQRKFAIWDANVRRGLSEYKNYVGRAASANKPMASRLKTDLLDDAEAFRKTTYAFVFDGAKQPPALLFSSGKKALTGLFGLADAGLPVLDEILHVRQRSLLTQGAISLVAVLVGLCAFLYLAYSFYLVMNGGLAEVERHMVAMSDGDLTTTPAPWGEDEVARLMHTMAHMQTALREIVCTVRVSSSSITTASDELATASKELSVRSEQSAASLQESACAMEEIASTVKSTADNAMQAATIANRNKETANDGGTVIGRVVQTMEDINVSSRRIGDIVGTMDGIAFQTNILALNAAVEAARAGEQGRGFAVVAAEVRALAQRSTVAAREIKSLIGASLRQVETGVTVVRNAGLAMGEIVSNAGQLDGLIDGIAQASHQQSKGVQQVGSAVQALDRMTQQNASLVEQSAAATAGLRQRAADLALQVARFRLPAVN
jgi:methyl-accepting chemotaxis protein